MENDRELLYLGSRIINHEIHERHEMKTDIDRGPLHLDSRVINHEIHEKHEMKIENDERLPLCGIATFNVLSGKKPFLDGIAHKFGLVVDIQFIHQIPAVRLNGARADLKTHPDLMVGIALAHQL